MNPKLLIFYDNIHLRFLQKLTFRFIQQKQQICSAETTDLFSRNKNGFFRQKQKRIYSAETTTDLFSRNKNGFIQQKQKRIYSAETKTDLFSRNKNGRYIFFIRKFLLWIRCGMETCKQRIPQNSVDKSCN